MTGVQTCALPIYYATERPACERLVAKLMSLGAATARLSDRDEDFRQFFTANPSLVKTA